MSRSSSTAEGLSRILVIKHGALGDFILATGPFAAIRRHHAAAHLTLLTTAPYEDAARRLGRFDEVWVDRKPGLHQLQKGFLLRRRLRGGRFMRVYDLQTSQRSNFYFRLLGRPRPEWSGVAPGCSHPHANPARDRMHTVERQAEQLAMAGIAAVPPPDISWMDSDLAGFDLADDFALLVPGSAPHRPAKRWPPTRFGALASFLAGRGIQPVVIGTAADGRQLAVIRATCPETLDLIGRTDLGALAALARRARLVIGNDTGPMHIAAIAGRLAVVLFSYASDPVLSAPRGPQVSILRRPSLERLTVDEVKAALAPYLDAAPSTIVERGEARLDS